MARALKKLDDAMTSERPGLGGIPGVPSLGSLAYARCAKGIEAFRSAGRGVCWELRT